MLEAPGGWPSARLLQADLQQKRRGRCHLQTPVAGLDLAEKKLRVDLAVASDIPSSKPIPSTPERA
jgi:hypothetical protein